MLKTLRVLLDQFEIADCVCCSVIALEGLAPGSDFDELRECMGLRAPAMRARVCESRLRKKGGVALGEHRGTCWSGNVAKWIPWKRKRERCVTPKGSASSRK